MLLFTRSVYYKNCVKGQSYYLPDQCIVKIVSKDKVIIYQGQSYYLPDQCIVRIVSKDKVIINQISVL